MKNNHPLIPLNEGETSIASGGVFNAYNYILILILNNFFAGIFKYSGLFSASYLNS